MINSKDLITGAERTFLEFLIFNLPVPVLLQLHSEARSGKAMTSGSSTRMHLSKRFPWSQIPLLTHSSSRGYIWVNKALFYRTITKKDSRDWSFTT